MRALSLPDRGFLVPGPLPVLLHELGREVGGDRACAFTVPHQLGVDAAALCAHIDACVLDAGTHARAGHLACGLRIARASCHVRAAGADHGGAARAVIDRQAQVASGALDREQGLQFGAGGVDVPLAVEAQVAAQAGGGEWRVAFAHAERVGPRQGNALDVARAAERPVAVARLGGAGVVPCQ